MKEEGEDLPPGLNLSRDELEALYQALDYYYGHSWYLKGERLVTVCNLYHRVHGILEPRPEGS